MPREIMTVKTMREFRADWESRAKKTAAERDHGTWMLWCSKIWVMDFVLGDVHRPGYRSAMDRIPFELEDLPAPCSTIGVEVIGDRANENAIRERI